MTTPPDRLTAALADRYALERELGQGGMATVYLAEDLKHRRKVAVKVLRPELAAVIGAERFLKEIEVTANLQHPHILPLFDSGEADSFLYYVMPYVEGESLRQRLDREKQLSVDETVRITSAVASALHYAHRQGVIHRDIKPENVLVHDGEPLVSDFGIALAVSHAGGTRITETGLSLGTPHYMSPEQATADRELDARSDIYSLAAIAYEMLTGEPPHSGGTAQAIIAAVVTEEPRPITARRKTVPPHIVAAIDRALSKLPADRFDAADAFADALTNATSVSTVVTATAAAAREPAGGSRWLVGIASVIAVLAVAAAIWGWIRVPAAEVLWLGVVMPSGEGLSPAPTRRIAISPDGSQVAYVGPSTAGASTGQLWVRHVSQFRGRPLSGTESAQSPFFSPDGRFVAFFTGDPGDLKIVPVQGGGSQTVVSDTVLPWGGDWSRDGYLYFAIRGGKLARFPAGGGAVEVVSTPDTSRGETFHEYPNVHPNGSLVVLQIWRSSASSAEIGVLSLETGEVQPLAAGLDARFLPWGDVLYSTLDRQLLVGKFDPSTLTFTEPPRVVLENVRTESYAGVGLFDVSDNGHLIYEVAQSGEGEQLVWVDRKGVAAPVDPNWTGDFNELALSPDGSKAAVVLTDPDAEGIWVKELDRGPLLRLTFSEDQAYRPTWSPDGQSVAFITGAGAGNSDVWWRRADGSAAGEPLVQLDALLSAAEWTPDGEWLLLRSSTGGDRNILGIRLGLDTVPRVFVGSRHTEQSPTVSPDGRWLAYVSGESGRDEVYIRPFPDTEQARLQASIGGGTEPRWAHSGRELFYRTPAGELAVRQVNPSGGSLRMEAPEILFDASAYVSDYLHYAYAVAPDDSRFLMIAANRTASSLYMVRNWLTRIRTALD